MSAGTGPARRTFVSIEIIRGVASLLVIYSHVVGQWLDPVHGGSWPTDAVQSYVAEPLHVSQSFGFFGVALFFVVSGFIVTATGTRETVPAFAVKRLLRIYPPLVVAVLLSALVITIGGVPLLAASDTSSGHLLASASLLNYLLVPQVIIIGAAWTLVVEVAFYLLTALLLPVLRQTPVVAVVIELALVTTVVAVYKDLGASFFLLAVSVSFLPVLVLGQLVWAVWDHRAPLWAGLVLGGTSWAIFVWAGQRDTGRLDSSYDVAAFYAVLVLIAGLAVEGRLRRHAVWSFFSDRSYSLYLVHGAVTLPVLLSLDGRTPPAVSLVLALAATAAVVEVVLRLVERPSQRLARALVRRGRQRGAAASALSTAAMVEGSNNGP